jgi:hypothetical protein
VGGAIANAVANALRGIAAPIHALPLNARNVRDLLLYQTK